MPPINYLFSKTLWLSTLYDYGLGGNNLGFFISKFIELNGYSLTPDYKLEINYAKKK